MDTEKPMKMKSVHGQMECQGKGMQKIADNYAKAWDYITHIDSKLELEFRRTQETLVNTKERQMCSTGNEWYSYDYRLC